MSSSDGIWADSYVAWSEHLEGISTGGQSVFEGLRGLLQPPEASELIAKHKVIRSRICFITP